MNIDEPLSRVKRGLAAVSLSCLLIGLLPHVSLAQAIEPQREQLLNGLRILVWTLPGDPNVLLKLRIHSGAAFDPAGKAGTMALLGNLLFPDAITHEYFTQEMGGRLEVETNHDAINITLQGRASDYDRIVDILREALVTTPLSVANAASIRATRIKALSETKSTPADIADRLIAERLLAGFPYARTVDGTVESLTRIERGDLMLAREKFLSPNNATLVIVGGVDKLRAMRALRQLLGAWHRSDQVVPATFRQPDPADARILIADAPGTATAEVRLATRGLARSDPDYFATTLLAALARERWQTMTLDPKGVFLVSADAHVLPGMFLMKGSVNSAGAAKTLADARLVLKSLVDSPVSPGEFESAKSEGLARITRLLAPNEGTATAWLDVDTYSLPVAADQMKAWNTVSAADLQRVAIRLFRETSMASVLVGNVEQLKAQVGTTAKFEVLGEAKPTAPVLPVKRPAPVLPANPNPFKKDTKPLTKPD